MRILSDVLKAIKATFVDSPDISLEALIKSFKLECRELLHCGAGLVEEALIYQQLNFSKVYWIEAHPEIFEASRNILVKFPNQSILQAALWDSEAILSLNVASNLGSSSLLNSCLHSDIFPDITFRESVAVKTIRLDNLKIPIDYGSLLVMDLQGAELKALHGASGLLSKLDYIYIEAAELELYEGAPRISDLIEFLSPDFKLVDWRISKKYHYGNLFFIRNQLVKSPRSRRLFRFLHSLRLLLKDLDLFTAN